MVLNFVVPPAHISDSRLELLQCLNGTASMELPKKPFRSLFIVPPLPPLSLSPSLAVLKLAASLSWPPADSDFFVPYSPSTRPPSCRPPPPPPPPPPYCNTLHTTLPSFLPSFLPPQSVQRQGAPVTLVGLGQWRTLPAWPACLPACLPAWVRTFPRERGRERHDFLGITTAGRPCALSSFFHALHPRP